MTARTHPIDLPQIPTLPPIQMPDASLFEPSSSVSTQSHISSSRRASPSPAPSQDTFLTAMSSPSSDLDTFPPSFTQDPMHSSHPLVQSSNLRKSISVDSFVKVKQPPSNRSSRGNTLSFGTEYAPDLCSASQLPVSSSARPPTTRHRVAPAASRSRGTSVSTAVDDVDESFFDDSDMERPDDHDRPVRNGKIAQRRAVPPGELILPSRLQSMSSYPTMNASSPNHGSSSDGSMSIVPVRSTSLSHKLSKQKSHMIVSTHPLPLPKPTEVTLAVIGAKDCGKSTVIRKGLKGHNVSDPFCVDVPSSPSGTGDDVFTYTYRTGRILGQNTPDRILRIIEVDISDFDLSQIGQQELSRGTPLDAIIVCYDAGEETSFRHVEEILRQFAPMKLPTLVFACKSDQRKRVSPGRASAILLEYDVGLVEVSIADQQGKDKMRNAFDWIFRSIFAIQDGRPLERDGYSNPASPAALTNTAPWDISRASSATPTAISSAIMITPQVRPANLPLVPQTSSHDYAASQMAAESSATPTRATHSPTQSRASLSSGSGSPTRARSSILFSEQERATREGKENHSTPRSVVVEDSIHPRPSLQTQPTINGKSDRPRIGPEGSPEGLRQQLPTKERRAVPWMTLDELLNKLLFMAVSDDDPVFISHFLLTHRRFASPRSVLLAMQKRMRSLEQPSGDPMFACYAQMRICLLLDNWIRLYPHDFAVPGAASALTAFVKSVLSKTHLLHYGSDFLPFLELLPSLKDLDKAWALKVDYPSDEADESLSQSDDEHSTLARPESPVFTNNHLRPVSSAGTSRSSTTVSSSQPQPPPSRERKQSLPLSSKSFLLPTNVPSAAQSDTLQFERNLKHVIKRLSNLSHELNMIDPSEIAQEITLLQLRQFEKIKARDWLQHVFSQGKKNDDSDPVARYGYISNHIGEWVTSLILCHDKPKARARQFEKFIEVANRLRSMDNYSGLRAVIAGINAATYDGDPNMELVKSRSPNQWKIFQSWDQLLHSARSHFKYRMALKNSKGACIPAAEIHILDLIRSQEGNADYYEDDPTRIHWAKFNMMGRFVDAITSCQKRCAESRAYDFKGNSNLTQMFGLDKPDWLMTLEMKETRMAPLPDFDEGYATDRPGLPRTSSRDTPLRDAAILKRIFFW